MILKETYYAYESALLILNLETLNERRDILYFRFDKTVSDNISN